MAHNKGREENNSSNTTSKYCKKKQKPEIDAEEQVVLTEYQLPRQKQRKEGGAQEYLVNETTGDLRWTPRCVLQLEQKHNSNTHDNGREEKDAS